MPLKKPGLWFLILQLSRILVLFLVWIQPGWTFLLAILFAWGLNMGVTTNLSRTIVQEASETQFLARILSVYNIGLMGSIPIGAVIIGYVIEQYGTMSAMIRWLGCTTKTLDKRRRESRLTAAMVRTPANHCRMLSCPAP